MGRLRTLTVLLIVCAWGAATEGAPPDSAAPPASSSARPPAPAEPVKYLQAGAQLFNTQQYGLAAKYLQAAQLYRDQLTQEQQQTLDLFAAEMAKVPAEALTGGTAPAAQPAETTTSAPAVTASPSDVAVTPAVAADPAQNAPAMTAAAGANPLPTQPPADRDGGNPRGPGSDNKQMARWKLQAAREMIRQGNYDEAAKKIEEVRGMDIKWGLFDETPAKLTQLLEKSRPKADASGAPGGQAKDRRMAKARLKEARRFLDEQDYDKAEAIALDVKSWHLSYSMFEDNPDKIAAAARALRSRQAQPYRGRGPQPSLGTYEVLVRESRKLMSEGKLEEAKAKALQALRMRVVPPVEADRADAVLVELQAMEQAKAAGTPLVATGAERASTVSEREANALLAKGDRQAASAKYAEAERLRMQEQQQSGVALTAPADPSVQRVDGGSAPALQPLPASEAPVIISQPADATPAVGTADSGRGEQLLSEARALYNNGNFPAARQMATQARTGGFGVDAKADEFLAQVGVAEQGGALSMYEAALNAVRANDWDKARVLLTEVSTSGAADESLSKKVQDLLARLPKDPAKGKAVTTELSNIQDAETLAAQKLNAEVGTRIAEARRLHEVDPDKALAIYADTIKTVKAADIPETLARPLVRRLEVGIELAKKDKVAFDIKMKDKTARAEIEQKRLRIFEADKAKHDKMKELMGEAEKAMASGDYDKAELFAKRAQEVDPNDVTPGIVAWKAKMENRMRREKDIRDRQEHGVVGEFLDIDEAATINNVAVRGGIDMPKNFKELSERRLRLAKSLQPKKSPRTLQIESKLGDPVTLNMDNQPLGEAIGFLANYTGLNIVLDPKALNEEGLTTASPVSLTASNITLKTALKLLLKPMGLTYHIEDEVLVITSPQVSQDQLETRTHYVGDLVMPPTSSQAGPYNPAKPSNPSNIPAQAAAMGAGAMPVNGSGGPQVSHNERPKPDMGPLIQLITASIAPGTWRVFDPEQKADVSAAYGMGGGFGGAGAGGADEPAQPIGSITPFFLSISLIIRHTSEIHEQVADLLRQLRRLQDLQVSIEVRFITVSDSFFEQIGVDFDFTIESKALGKHSTIAQTNPAATLFVGGNAIQTSGTTAGGTTTGTGTLGGTGGGNLGGGGLGGGGLGGGGLGGAGGLGGGGSLGGGGGGSLGGGGGASAPAPIIVNTIRDYTTPSSGPIVVGTSAGGIGNFTPDLTIPFNQASASLIAPSNSSPGAGATFGIAFLSDLEVFLFLTAAQGDTRTNILQAPKVTTFNGAAAFIINTEQINFVESLLPIVGFGSVAFVPQVQSFPNGVQLQVTPVVSADRRYVRMTLSPNFTAIEGFDTIQVPAAVGGGGLGGGSAAINGTIQLPRFTVTTVSTTVTVPDGGTVLLGGVKRLNEQRLEFGVPVLSKTPLLNRLFRNIGIGRITSSLMLMVTPRIIILEEEEEKLGIPTIAL